MATFKRQFKGGGFRDRKRDFGDFGAAALKSQRATETTALQRQKQSYSETHEGNLRSIEKATSTTAEVRQDVKNFKDVVQEREAQAIRTRRDQEVKKLEDEARIVGQQGKFWGQFSQTLGKNLGDIATGLIEQRNRKLTEEANLEPTPHEINVNNGLYEGNWLSNRKLIEQSGVLYAANQKVMAQLNNAQSSKYPVAKVDAIAARATKNIDNDLSDSLSFYARHGATLDFNNIDRIYKDTVKQLGRSYGFLQIAEDGTEQWVRANEVTKWRIKWAEKLQEDKRTLKNSYLSRNGKEKVQVDLQAAIDNDLAPDLVRDTIITQLMAPDENNQYPDLPGAIDSILVDKIGSDATIPLSKKLALIKMPSINWGPFKPQKEGETIEDRISGIEQRITEAHHKAVKKAQEEVDEKNKVEDAKFLNQVKQKQLGIGDYAINGTKQDQAYINNPELMLKDKQTAIELGYSKSTSYLAKYLGNDPTKYSQNAQRIQVQKMINNNDLVRAVDVVNNSSSLTSDAKRELLANNPIIQKLNSAGHNPEQVEDESEEFLKGVLGYSPLKSKFTTPSIDRSVNRFERLFYNKLNSIEGKTVQEAYQEAMQWSKDYVEKHSKPRGTDGSNGSWELHTSDSSFFGGGTKEFKIEKDGFGDLDPDTGISAATFNQNVEDLRNNPNIWKERKLISPSLTKQLHNSLNRGEKVQIPRILIRASKLSGTPLYQLVNAEFARSYAGVDYTEMKPGFQDIAKSQTLGDKNFDRYNSSIDRARSTGEIQVLANAQALGFRAPETMAPITVSKSAVPNSPIAPILSAVISDRRIGQSLGAMFNQFPTVEYQPAVVDDFDNVVTPEILPSGMNLQHIQITNPGGSTFRVIPNTDTWNLMITHGEKYGIEYDATTMSFYYGGY